MSLTPYAARRKCLVALALVLACTGRALADLSGYASSVNALAFTPDGRRLLSGSSDGTVRIWGLAE